MKTFAIWFEDLTLCPERAEHGSTPAKGMPEDWMDAIKGVAKIERRRHLAPGILSGVVVSLPDPWHSEHFNSVLRQVARKLGTNPWVRDYEDAGHRQFWDSGAPIISEY